MSLNKDYRYFPQADVPTNGKYNASFGKEQLYRAYLPQSANIDLENAAAEDKVPSKGRYKYDRATGQYTWVPYTATAAATTGTGTSATTDTSSKGGSKSTDVMNLTGGANSSSDANGNVSTGIGGFTLGPDGVAVANTAPAILGAIPVVGSLIVSKINESATNSAAKFNASVQDTNPNYNGTVTNADTATAGVNGTGAQAAAAGAAAAQAMSVNGADAQTIGAAAQAASDGVLSGKTVTQATADAVGAFTDTSTSVADMAASDKNISAMTGTTSADAGLSAAVTGQDAANARDSDTGTTATNAGTAAAVAPNFGGFDFGSSLGNFSGLSNINYSALSDAIAAQDAANARDSDTSNPFGGTADAGTTGAMSGGFGDTGAGTSNPFGGGGDGGDGGAGAASDGGGTTGAMGGGFGAGTGDGSGNAAGGDGAGTGDGSGNAAGGGDGGAGGGDGGGGGGDGGGGGGDGGGGGGDGGGGGGGDGGGRGGGGGDARGGLYHHGKFDQRPRMAQGGLSALAAGGLGSLGDYSDGGRLLRGPGDGVSDSIPAVIGKKRPARLADGEFVVPARIVSELGNGSTEAGARKLYAMLDRIQAGRKKSIGKGKVATNSRADKNLPA